MRNLRIRLLAVLLCAAGVARPALSQNTITLEGRAVSAGAPVAGAQVTAVNIATQETARATTRPNGEFRLLGLFAGEYTVAVRAIGFKPVSHYFKIHTMFVRSDRSLESFGRGVEHHAPSS